MDENKKAVDDFLDGLANDGEQDPLQPDKDPFEATPQEEKEVKAQEDEAVEEKVKPIPFHKDPKVQRYIEREIAKRIPKQEAEDDAEDYFSPVVDSFTKIIGNDTPEKVQALNELRDSLSNLDKVASDRALRTLQSQQEAEQEEEAYYEDQISQGFDDIEASTGIDLYAPQNKKLKGQFLDFVEQIAPKEDGEMSDLPDMEQAFRAFSSTRRVQANKAKDLASRSNERSSDASQDVYAPKGTDPWAWARKKMGLE